MKIMESAWLPSPLTSAGTLRERMDLIRELRAKLRGYHETLLLQSQIAQLKHPENRVLAAVKQFFERPHHILGGKAKTILNNLSDLVTLKAPAEADYLSNFLRQHWTSQTSISLAVNLITILIEPILALNFAPDPTAKLVMISIFTAAATAAYAAMLVVFVSNDELSSGTND
ncbi:hypothetical protein F4775DRAFT_595050 [Biscogniauxia sp. FL1348]|nr:hypothetical protein F4775DRAFT_595050 [Biscogniauxia sp. FL1348]